ncbi:DUF1631 family protein [Porticoccus sp.]
MTDINSPPQTFFKLPQPVLALQGRARTYLAACLNSMFDQVDDTFFDLADRADNNRQQTLYFDAMRMIRVERKNIEHHFFRALTQGFQQLGNATDTGFSPRSRQQGLEVIENDRLEEIIALDTMVSKAAELCKAELDALNVRIGSLVPAAVTMKNNPVGPDVICESFNEAVAHLDLKIPIKLVFFKLFERHVTVPLKDFLTESNRRFREMGILPDLEQVRKAKAEKPPEKPKRPPDQAAVTGDASTNSAAGEGRQESKNLPLDREAGRESPVRYGQFISQLKNLLQWDSRAGNQGEAGATSGERVGAEQLSSMVGNLQQDWSETVKGSKESPKSLLEVVEAHLAQQGSNLGGTERGVIDLLDRLFVRVNSEAIASTEIAEELRKLELPILQIALRDATFFDREKHPARRLLNEIAEAAIGYADEFDSADDPVARAISSVIDELCNESRRDNVALTHLLLNFIDLVEKERRRVAVLEQRLMEEVAATEKINQAHQAVLKVLMERVQGKTLPRFVMNFAEEAWCKVLFLNHLRSGVDSQEWQQSIQLLDRLLELVHLGNRQKTMVQTVLASIRESLESIAFDAYDLGRLMGAMEQYFSGENTASNGVEDNALLRGISANPMEDVYIQILRTDIPGNPGSQDDDEEEIDEQYLRRADSLSRGVWVELDDVDPSRRRCKVAGVILPAGTFVFVNRQGAKVSEKNRNRVARELKDDKLRMLDKSRLFDRALQGVVDDMCQNRSLH